MIFNQRPVGFSLLVLAILVALFSVGYKLVYYISFPQFNGLLQTFSSLWISLVILALAVYFGQFSTIKDYKIKSFLITFVFAVFIGVVWKLIENFYQLTDVAAPDYSLNTAIDLMTNALGGTIAHFYFVMKRRNKVPVVSVVIPFADKESANDSK